MTVDERATATRAVPSGPVTQPAVAASVLGADRARLGTELLVAGSAVLAHPDGKRAAVAEVRRSFDVGSHRSA